MKSPLLYSSEHHGTAGVREAIAILLLWVSAVVTGCGLNEVGGGGGGVSSGLAYRAPYAWPLSTPAAQGMDSARTLGGLRQIWSSEFLTSFLIVRNDKLVLEYYAPGIVPENDFNVQGISGNFISALVGIALDNRSLPSVNEQVLDFFPSFDTTHLDARKRLWTIEHLLTMRSGMDWNENTTHSSLFTSGNNWINVDLGLPLQSAPGDTFIYTLPNANILAAILNRVSGSSIYEFAESNLFERLNIAVRSWAADPQGIYLGGGDMRFTPRDLARFGQLYLHNGLIDGRQIIPRSWIQQSLAPRNKESAVKGDFKSLNFGYLWWTNADGGDSLFFASGYGGQMILVSPSRSMIIVVIADDMVGIQQAGMNEEAVIAIIRNYFL